ncbi:hypothetical protein H5410_009226 [Solanum commersonii]|uniref:Uncharacterized protein n=1 Tax=Solanum commersonii TaxID=4109 RepID=A0A9J6AHD6_SOLCO|nr:hypothetical protein H5410_009226 [Solanum commersonii]
MERQSLSINHVHEMLSNKLFYIQLRKSSWGNSNNTHTTLSILSYVEKEQTLPPNTIDRNSKKIRPLGIGEVEMMAITTAAGSSKSNLQTSTASPTPHVGKTSTGL